MALHSFCGILTLQVGVAMTAVIFWVIGALTFVVNFFEFFNADTFIIILTISSFVILLILSGLIAFFSAYNESNSLCMAGVAITSLNTVVWVTLSSFSFYNNKAILGLVCIHDRCPETFWLAPLKYRLEPKLSYRNHSNSQYDYSTPSDNNETQLHVNDVNDLNVSSLIELHDLTVLNGKHFHNLEIVHPSFDVAYYIHVEDEIPTNDYNKNGYIFGIPLIGAVILFICNFFLMLFSILVLWSYGQELAWTNAYLSDIPEYSGP